jgi:hypothetical protein
MLADFNDYGKTLKYQNPWSGSGVVPCGRIDKQMDGRTDRQTDTTQLIAFYSFANVRNNRRDLVPNYYKLSILVYKAIPFLAWTGP